MWAIHNKLKYNEDVVS